MESHWLQHKSLQLVTKQIKQFGVRLKHALPGLLFPAFCAKMVALFSGFVKTITCSKSATENVCTCKNILHWLVSWLKMQALQNACSPVKTSNSCIAFANQSNATQISYRAYHFIRIWTEFLSYCEAEAYFANQMAFYPFVKERKKERESDDKELFIEWKSFVGIQFTSLFITSPVKINNLCKYSTGQPTNETGLLLVVN